jgi:23S rRNA (adenine2503-C2)-methyltransferase
MPQIVRRERASDGSTKVVLALSDGARIEAVHMPRSTKNPRVTVCLSSQVGCAMGCGFCRTAEMGLVRNLTAQEIIGQLFAVLRDLGPADTNRLTLVFMGMGEPLHNVQEVLRATFVLTDPRGLGLSPSRITVSTVGIVPAMVQMSRAERRPGLALSVNATTDEARAAIMPIARKWSLAELRETLAAFRLRPHEKVTLAYVLLSGVNDTDADAERLAAFASGFRHVVNVIPFNAFDGARFERGHEDRHRAFAAKLHALGAFVTVRATRGTDVTGACGQLATETRRSHRRALTVV